MFCPKCGFEYREGYKICSDCGSSLVESIDLVEKQHGNEGRLRLLFGSLILALITGTKNLMNSKTISMIPYVSYKMFFVFLFMFNISSMRIDILYALGPGWEIPVALVWPIHFWGLILLVSLLACLILFVLGFRRFRMQRRIDKSISLLWLLSSVFSRFIFNFGSLPEDYVSALYKYGWVISIIPLLLSIYLLIQDHKIEFKNDLE